MSSGVPWIDKKLGELSGAREFLAQCGMAPQRTSGDSNPELGESRYAAPSRWRVPFVVDTLTDAELIALAKDRGFRHG